MTYKGVMLLTEHSDSYLDMMFQIGGRLWNVCISRMWQRETSLASFETHEEKEFGLGFRYTGN